MGISRHSASVQVVECLSHLDVLRCQDHVVTPDHPPGDASARRPAWTTQGTCIPFCDFFSSTVSTFTWYVPSWYRFVVAAFRSFGVLVVLVVLVQVPRIGCFGFLRHDGFISQFRADDASRPAPLFRWHAVYGFAPFSFGKVVECLNLIPVM